MKTLMMVLVLSFCGCSLIPASQQTSPTMGVTITDAVLGAFAVTAALLANESASRYNRCVAGDL